MLDRAAAERGCKIIEHAVKINLRDCSTPDEFCFSLCCAVCGETWKSIPVRFSRAGVLPAGEGKRVIYETLYKREKEIALRKALEQVKEGFNLCPICKRLVCDHCFLICDDLDMCCDCARRLEEKGEPVKERSKAQK